MAAPAPTLFGMRDAEARLTEAVERIKSRYAGVQGAASTDEGLSDVLYETRELLAILVTCANGITELPEQTVTVEYLKQHQLLLIPAALGMSPVATARGEARAITLLIDRYWKTSSLPYAQLAAMANALQTPANVQQTIDALNAAPGTTLVQVWRNPTHWSRADGTRATQDEADLVYAYISNALQYNCDIRDFGLLMVPELRTTDDAWKTATDTTKDRLSVRMFSHTRLCIAALNYDGCNRYALSAWTRSYGVAIGLLPSLTSKSQKEYKYTLKVPTAEQRTAVANFERECNVHIYPLCLNVLSMYGLLHLNKDHTFKTGDANMERICVSYIMTLRTMVPVELQDSMKSNIEAVCRTASHPFGLAQTYWLALTMGQLRTLAPPLAIRIDVCPPPVQRILIVRAAVGEWMNLPVGKRVAELFDEQIAVVMDEYKKISASPPSYSGLSALYGISPTMHVSDAAKKAADSMMPCIYGFAMATHSQDNQKKEGLALAMSFENVARDQKALVTTYTTLWEKYLDDVDSAGLVSFVTNATRTRGESAGAGAGASSI